MTMTNPGTAPEVRDQGASSLRKSARTSDPMPLRRWGFRLAWLLVAAYLVFGLAVPLFVALQRSVGIDPFWRAYGEQLVAPSLLLILGRSLLFAAVATLVISLISYPVAYAMTLMGRRSRTVLLALLIVPYLTSFLVRTYAWIGILGVKGPVVAVLHWFGIRTPTLDYTAIGVLAVLVNVFLPVVVLTCYVSMSRIDPSHLRAARTLGANHLESFWRVYAPQTKSGVMSGAVLVFIQTVGMYVAPALIGGPSESTVVTLVVQQVVQGETFGVSPAYSASLSVILAVVVVLVLALTARSLGAGEVFGLTTGGRLNRKDSKPKRQRSSHQSFWAVVRRIPVGSGRRHILIRAMVVLAVIVIDGPLVYLFGMSFQPLPLLAFPTGGWSTTWYTQLFDDPSWGDAVQLSLQTALLATALALVVGGFLALRTSKVRPFARSTIVAAAVLPLIVPAIMYATGVHTVFTQLGLIGNWQAIAVVHSFIAMPYVYVNILNALSSYDPRWDQAAHSLGASPWRRLRRVTLPLLRPALLTAAVLAILTSIDEFTVTLFVGGITFQNLALKFWSDARQNLSPELAAVGVLLIGLTLAIAAFAALGLYATRRSANTNRSET